MLFEPSLIGRDEKYWQIFGILKYIKTVKKVNWIDLQSHSPIIYLFLQFLLPALKHTVYRHCIASKVSYQAKGLSVFSLDRGVFSLDRGVFSLDRGVFSLDRGVFSLDRGVFSDVLSLPRKYLVSNYGVSCLFHSGVLSLIKGILPLIKGLLSLTRVILSLIKDILSY